MGRRAILLMATMAAALVVATGVASAATFTCTANPCVGTEGDDTITGTEGDDFIRALGGDDQVYGQGGNDIIDLGAGVDYASGDAGNDIIVGGPGDPELRSVLLGGLGNDLIIGGDSEDEVQIGEGTNFVFGLGDDDFIRVDDPDSRNDFALGGGGFDFIDAKDGARDFLSCGPDFDVVAVDAVDVVASDCEEVNVASAGGAASKAGQPTGIEADTLKQRAQQLEAKAKELNESAARGTDPKELLRQAQQLKQQAAGASGERRTLSGHRHKR